MIRVAVNPQVLDVSDALAALEGEGVGAIASFTGLVRGGGGLTALTLEHYPAMTFDVLHALAAEAERRWSLAAATIMHRCGTMVPGERIVFVGTAAPHRAPALEACTFLIDALKTRAPFWKREAFSDGRAHWVAARAEDDEAAARWG
jgi:molybdopterin synthase catalytic subunit